MNRKLLALGFACACSGSVMLNAQTAQQAQPPSASTPAAVDQNSTAVTVEGCLMREVDVPGRKPIETDRARVKADDDYILIDTKMVKGTAPSAVAPRAADDKPVGTSGASAAPLMFEVEKLSADTLNPLRGRRVQIDGTFNHVERAQNPVSPATDLVELFAASIRQVEGECPAK